MFLLHAQGAGRFASFGFGPSAVGQRGARGDPTTPLALPLCQHSLTHHHHRHRHGGALPMAVVHLRLCVWFCARACVCMDVCASVHLIATQVMGGYPLTRPDAVRSTCVCTWVVQEEGGSAGGADGPMIRIHPTEPLLGPMQRLIVAAQRAPAHLQAATSASSVG